MKYLDWDDEKNEWLKKMRGVSFEEVKSAIEDKRDLDIIDHPNQNRYPGQKMYVVDIKNYIYLVPFVADEFKEFLKTIIPSRKAKKKYIERKK